MVKLLSSDKRVVATLEGFLTLNPEAKPKLRFVTHMLPAFKHRTAMSVAHWSYGFRIEDLSKKQSVVSDTREYDYDTLCQQFGWSKTEYTRLRVQLLLNSTWVGIFTPPVSIPAYTFDYYAELIYLYIFVRAEKPPRAFRSASNLIDENEYEYRCIIRMNFVDAKFMTMRYDALVEAVNTQSTHSKST